MKCVFLFFINFQASKQTHQFLCFCSFSFLKSSFVKIFKSLYIPLLLTTTDKIKTISWKKLIPFFNRAVNTSLGISVSNFKYFRQWRNNFKSAIIYEEIFYWMLDAQKLPSKLTRCACTNFHLHNVNKFKVSQKRTKYKDN